MRQLADIVREHPFMKDLDESFIQLIAGCAKNEVYKPGEYIFREGAKADSFYLVREGNVALEIHDPARGAISFLTVKGGEILGYSSLLEPYLCLYDARAVVQTRVLSFDHQCLIDKCEFDNQFGYEIMKRIMLPLVERLQAARFQSVNLYASQST